MYAQKLNGLWLDVNYYVTRDVGAKATPLTNARHRRSTKGFSKIPPKRSWTETPGATMYAKMVSLVENLLK